nr:hypothetical protein [Pandoraea nosoerga]
MAIVVRSLSLSVALPALTTCDMMCCRLAMTLPKVESSSCSWVMADLRFVAYCEFMSLSCDTATACAAATGSSLGVVTRLPDESCAWALSMSDVLRLIACVPCSKIMLVLMRIVRPLLS